MLNTRGNIRGQQWLLIVFMGAVALSLAGCHDWPDERATAIEAASILRDLARIEPVPDPNVTIPDVYKTPPRKVKQVVGGAEEWKLFYFCQYHTAEKIKKIVHEQFATLLFNKKGQSTTIRDYTVTANPDTNQLVVRCPTEQDIDAVMELIREVDIPPIQVRIECMVSELYADMTMDRETTLLIENLFGEQITMGGKQEGGRLLPAFPGAALRDPAREKFGLKIGVSRANFEALVDILVSRGYLKILMNPRLTVLNGQPAKIEAREHVPLQQISIRGGFGSTTFIESRTEYYDIIDSLEITPHAFADGFIGLETHAQISAYLTPEGIKQVPIVTERTITNKDNRIRHGESLIIGGIRKTEKRDVIRGVPFLKDIPGLNLLFSGRDFEERAKEVIFIITPTISTGGKPNKDVIKMLRERHDSPYEQAFHEAALDPLGLKAREEARQRQIDEARASEMECEAESTLVRLEAIETSEQLEALLMELREAQSRLEQTAAAAEEAKNRAEQATAEAKQAKDAAQKASAEAREAKATVDQAQKSGAEQKEGEKPAAQGQ